MSKLSSVANTLINAAKSGKEVIVQIELQARFDETANIDYAKLMQDEGVKLIFGIPNLKVHAKICLVEKEVDNKIKKYGFVSTGNFNESTAKIYTDFTIFHMLIKHCQMAPERSRGAPGGPAGGLR